METNLPNTEIKRWEIIVIESIPDNEIQTGKELYDDLLNYKETQDEKCFSIFYDVSNLVEFKNVVTNILNNIHVGDILTLQIETHGCESGIVLKSGEIIVWKELYRLIRPINIKIGHLLLLVLSMCKSISMLSSIDPENRAPYRAIICTIRDMYPDELYKGFMAFYDKFYNILNIGEALPALQNEIVDIDGKTPFHILSAENVFNETFNELRNIDDVCISQLRRLGEPITSTTIKDMHSKIKNIFKDIHKLYYDYYNFIDQYES